MKKELKKALCTLGLVGGLGAVVTVNMKDKNILDNAIVKEVNENKIEIITIGRTLYIEDKGTFSELSDSFYEELNNIIKDENILTLQFENNCSFVDFSKLDLSSIRTIEFVECHQNFLNFSLPINCEWVGFKNTSEEMIKEILKNNDTQNISVYIENEKDETLLSYLVENNICIKGIHYARLNNNNSLSNEEMVLLSRINAKNLDIYIENFEETLNLDLRLNPNIKNFRIYNDGENVNLGSIKILAKPWCDIDFQSVNINANTKFCLSTGTELTIEGECESVEPFYNLYDLYAIKLKTNLGNYRYDVVSIDNNAFLKFMNELEKNLGNKTGVQKEKIKENPLHVVFLEDEKSTLLIQGKDLENPQELDDAFYEKLSIQIASYPEAKTLLFYNLNDNTIDFSKIKFDNVEQYEEIDFNKISFNSAKGLLNAFHANHLPFIYWGEVFDKESELKLFLDYLIENNKKLDELYIYEKNRNNNQGINPSDFQLASQVETKKLNICSDGFKDPISLDLSLNETISEFNMFLFENLQENFNENFDYSKNSELGSLSIHSHNKDLNINILNANVTSNTKFSIPDFAKISLSQFECSNIKALNDLENVEQLSLGNNVSWQGTQPGYITYSKNESEFECEENQIPPFNDFNKMMKFINEYADLLKIRKKLNVSPNEETDYVNTFSIGDVVELYKNDAFYDYRCIHSINMIKEESIKTVTDMEEYEELLKEGYVIYNYNLVDNILIKNGDKITFAFGNFKEEDSLKIVLARVPFKQ